MAIITCPSCRKRISSLNKACPHCNYSIGHSGEGLPLQEAKGRVQRKRKASLRMQAYTALLIFVAGIAWIWFGRNDGSPEAFPIALYVTAAAALWYIVIRIVMVWPKLKRR